MHSIQSKADYTYEYRAGFNALSIIDLVKGHISVTEDIEQVVTDISNKEKLNPFLITIVYRDELMFWCGYNYHTERFYGCTEEELALVN